MKICPFSENKVCNDECPLYISPDDLNEFVRYNKPCGRGVFVKNACTQPEQIYF